MSIPLNLHSKHLALFSVFEGQVQGQGQSQGQGKTH